MFSPFLPTLPTRDVAWRPEVAISEPFPVLDFRRVLGVLVEKAKTTPDSYPLTVNAIKTGCNQKSNRNPQMDLAADDIMATLDELRELRAVSEVQGDGRADKYRHRAYDWLDVDKVELAVLAELLLRGEQTVGELRGRAARMEPISGLPELMPILGRLREKGLLWDVTPQGRGQIVSHRLFLPSEKHLPDVPAASEAPAPSQVAVPVAAPQQAEGSLESRLQALEQRVKDLENRLGSADR